MGILNGWWDDSEHKKLKEQKKNVIKRRLMIKNRLLA